MWSLRCSSAPRACRLWMLRCSSGQPACCSVDSSPWWRRYRQRRTTQRRVPNLQRHSAFQRFFHSSTCSTRTRPPPTTRTRSSTGRTTQPSPWQARADRCPPHKLILKEPSRQVGAHTQQQRVGSCDQRRLPSDAWSRGRQGMLMRVMNIKRPLRFCASHTSLRLEGQGREGLAHRVSPPSLPATCAPSCPRLSTRVVTLLAGCLSPCSWGSSRCGVSWRGRGRGEAGAAGRRRRRCGSRCAGRVRAALPPFPSFPPAPSCFRSPSAGWSGSVAESAGSDGVRARGGMMKIPHREGNPEKNNSDAIFTKPKLLQSFSRCFSRKTWSGRMRVDG